MLAEHIVSLYVEQPWHAMPMKLIYFQSVTFYGEKKEQEWMVSSEHYD
jgi:hypothetical protein